MSIQGKPAEPGSSASLEAFRSGAPLKDVAKEKAQEQSQAQQDQAEPPKPEAQDSDAAYSAQTEIAKRAMNSRVSKTTRISQYHNLCLREYSGEQTKLQGRNVSEADVLEEALNEFFKKRKFVLK